MRNAIALPVLLLFLIGTAAAAAASEGKGKGMGNGGDQDKNNTGKDKSWKENKTTGPSNAIDAVNRSIQRGKASNASIQARLDVIAKLQAKIGDEKAKAGNETNSNRDKTKQFKNQNIVRERVMALLAVRNMTQDPGIGQEVSEVARNFSNSVNKTQAVEEKIDRRGWLSRLFFGGDQKAAEEMLGEVELNRGRINQLRTLSWMVDAETRQFMEEQLAELEAEQDRLTDVAQNEKKGKGLLGWLYK